MNNQFNNQPLISIIMNCYNGETYLRESIESVIFQTYKNWELIFWDNKSDDKSAEIFKSYKDKRLKYYCANTHTILYKARNEAIQKSSGEFLAFLDTDDFWEKDKLELQIKLFKDQEVGVVYGNCFIVNQKLNKKTIYQKKMPKGYILENLLKNYCTGLVTLVIRKSFLKNYDTPFDSSFHIMGDFDLMIRMSTKYKFDCIEKPVATWRVHGKNESLLNKSRQVEELKRWRNKMEKYPLIYKNKNFKNINIMISNLQVTNLILENKLDKAREEIKKMPNSFKKIKFLFAILLPNNFVKKFIQY